MNKFSWRPGDVQVMLPTNAIEKSEHWGKAGSGILYVCPSDQTMFLGKRSELVTEPGTWNVIGGAVTGTDGYNDAETVEAPAFTDKQLMDSAKREVREELGIQPPDATPVGQTVFEDGGFKYTTFIMAVTPEQKAEMTAAIRTEKETHGHGWWNPETLPTPLHPGVRYTLDNFDVTEAMQEDALLKSVHSVLAKYVEAVAAQDNTVEKSTITQPVVKDGTHDGALKGWETRRAD